MLVTQIDHPIQEKTVPSDIIEIEKTGPRSPVALCTTIQLYRGYCIYAIVQ